jgi:hypothetical protein
LNESEAHQSYREKRNSSGRQNINFEQHSGDYLDFPQRDHIQENTADRFLLPVAAALPTYI